jgi:hypothetical protein
MAEQRLIEAIGRPVVASRLWVNHVVLKVCR